MWQTIIGGLCVAGGCAGLGWAAFMHLESRVRLLSAFVELCDRLNGEIAFRLTPLPELGKRLNSPILHMFWKFIEDKYTLGGDETYGDVWKTAVQELDLADIDRALISDMGDVLGQYDADNQTQALSLLRDQLKISLEEAREKRLKQGRVVGMLGVLCGALLVVILL